MSPSPTLDQRTIRRLERLLRAAPCTVDHLCERLDVSEKTVYRYLRIVEEQVEPDHVVRLGSERPTRYRIIHGQ